MYGTICSKFESFTYRFTIHRYTKNRILPFTKRVTKIRHQTDANNIIIACTRYASTSITIFILNWLMWKIAAACFSAKQSKSSSHIAHTNTSTRSHIHTLIYSAKSIYIYYSIIVMLISQDVYIILFLRHLAAMGWRRIGRVSVFDRVECICLLTMHRHWRAK